MSKPDHIVVVVEENHDSDQIVGNANAQYINGTLIADGLYYSNAHGTDHPSQPNYLEMFAGVNPGVQGVNSPLQQRYPSGAENTAAGQSALANGDNYNTGQPFSNANLGSELLAAGDSFAGYSEGQPSVGFTGAQANGVNGNRAYVEKHNAWAQFQGTGTNQLPASTNQPFTTFQSTTDFSTLPTVSYVVPNEYNDMHDTVSKDGLYAVGSTGFDRNGNPVNDASTIQNGDTWLKNNLEAYRQWATAHNSLLITVWDENDYDFTNNNNISMVVDGAANLVQQGVNSSYVNHFDVLKTIEQAYGLAPTGAAATASGLPAAASGMLLADPQVSQIQTFGATPTGLTAPDSITTGNGSLFVEYGNGADSTGASGSSTILQYDMSGNVQFSYTIAGSVDGLKYNPYTGSVWALQNQDGNSTLSIINPTTHAVTGPVSFANASSVRGYDDVVFKGDRVFLSYTNASADASPNNAPTLVELIGGEQALSQGNLLTQPILTTASAGLNTVTGVTGAVPQIDPDSLKLAANGDLIFSSGDGGVIIDVSHPGTSRQSVSYTPIAGVTAGSAGLDDVIRPDSNAGTFYVTDPSGNRVVSFHISNLNTNDYYGSVGGAQNAFGQIDPATGAFTALMSAANLSGFGKPHGVSFVADPGTAAAAIGASAFFDASSLTGSGQVLVDLLDGYASKGGASVTLTNIQGVQLGGDAAVVVGLASSTDLIYGGTGELDFYNQGADDIIHGGTGINKIVAGAGTTSFYSGGGTDTMLGSATGTSAMVAGATAASTDVFYGHGGTDFVLGGAGTTILLGAGGTETFTGGSGFNELIGQNTADASGRAGFDVFHGGAGTDLFYAGIGTNLLTEGSGTDTLVGNAGTDIVYGGSGRSFVYGGTGTDVVTTGAGNQYVKAGSGTTLFSDTAAGLNAGRFDQIDNFAGGKDVELYLPTAVKGATSFVSQNGGTAIMTSVGSGSAEVFVSNASATMVQSHTHFTL